MGSGTTLFGVIFNSCIYWHVRNIEYLFLFLPIESTGGRTAPAQRGGHAFAEYA